MASGEYSIERFEAPLSAELISELSSLWQVIYGQDYHNELRVHAGEEEQYNHNIYYLIWDGGKVVSTAHATISRNDPRLGGLGEVATISEHRGRGLAQKLCQQAADEFTNCGGEALFLGTANPIAARVYGRVGWQHLSNSDVMLRITGTQGTHEYISSYFNGGANLTVEVVEGGARQRIGMIPLIVQPHEWITLDANVGLLSTRVSKQTSCMGLYPKYSEFEKSGEWFAAERSDGATVGLASIKLIDPDTSQVDAFTQVPQHFKTTETLYRLALKCLTATNSNRVRAVCDDGDELKRSILTRIGFRATKQTIRVETAQSLITLREYHLT